MTNLKHIIFGQCFLPVISKVSLTVSYLNMLNSSKRVKVILSLFTPWRRIGARRYGCMYSLPRR